MIRRAVGLNVRVQTECHSSPKGWRMAGREMWVRGRGEASESDTAVEPPNQGEEIKETFFK